MINTQAFKIKTIFQPRLNPSVPKYWGVAIDIGYSSVKIFSPNMVASSLHMQRKYHMEQLTIQLASLKETALYIETMKAMNILSGQLYRTE